MDTGLCLLTFVYDGDGNRVSETVGSTTTKYLVDDKNPTGYSQVMDETVNGSVTRTYTYGRQLISENQLVGSIGAPIASSGTTPNPYLYSGERYDSSLNL